MLWQSYRVAKQKLQRDKRDEMQNPNCSWKVKNRNFEKKRFCYCSTVGNWLNKRQPTEFLNHINLWSCGMHDLVVVEIKTTVPKNSQGKKKWENIIEQQLMLLTLSRRFSIFEACWVFTMPSANALWVFKVQEAFLVVCRLIELIIQQTTEKTNGTY